MRAVFIMIISWWSCRVLPPGPKGNLLFVFKHSLNYFLTTHPSEIQTKTAGLSRCKLFPETAAARLKGKKHTYNTVPSMLHRGKSMA